MNNLNLTFDQMAELTYKVAGQDAISLDEFKQYLKENCKELES